ncbi:mitochondrial mRNA processing protein Cox24 (predicted) [Sugiyamaella lignohabitans]|uniref:Mitochondrial mRNA processing protein Cox24 (Predicted) n=1 Tax=Sugiyamaella lignohabitans TaxID=796027 RepID=A0A167EQM7_9ASCO|nr:mitochondrial mRNA processing protein Cox24 (predicted) [Sugiyamaella lignohabitans]ANB14354.1 mitochondrial mRNA processing protein Cox24 (predicted) [Sugiyamaella lignohabitans]
MLSRFVRPTGSALRAASSLACPVSANAFHVLSSASGDAVLTCNKPKRRSNSSSSKALGKKNGSDNSGSSTNSKDSAKATDSESASDLSSTSSSSFPFSNLSEKQFQQWADEIRESELPVQAFFARHRPLLVMDTADVNASRQFADESRYVPVWSPRTNLFEVQQSNGGHYGENSGVSGVSSLIPMKVAKQLGPFNIEHVDDPLTRSLSGMTLNSQGMPNNKRNNTPNMVTGCTVLNLKDGDKHSPETTTVIFARTTNDESPLQTVISFLNNNAPESYATTEISSSSLANFGLTGGMLDITDADVTTDISATSVKRKRKLKMNRHKYKKRIKAQRSLKKRLGK